MYANAACYKQNSIFSKWILYDKKFVNGTK